MMMQRGLTLVELLLALALLASLSVVGVDWAITATRLSDTSGDTARWNAAAQATLDRMVEDIHTADARRDERRSATRLWPDEGRFTLLTRDSGAARVVYELNSRTSDLTRRNDRDTRMLLGDVSAFMVEIEPIPDPEDPDREPVRAILTLTITGTSDQSVSRKLIVPTEWLP